LYDHQQLTILLSGFKPVMLTTTDPFKIVV